MSSTINSVVVIGRLTRDPEVRYTAGENQTAVCTFAVAVNGRAKVGGEWTDRADFFDVVMYGNRAEAVGEHLKKGALVGVSGSLYQDRWEKDGERRSKVVIKAADVEFLDKKQGAGDTSYVPSDVVPDDDIPFR
jgi:single-strand DNA-binding protein